MEWIAAGLAFGFLGSFHCIGMCGPIALSLPRENMPRFSFVLSRLIYNGGRIVTYTSLGILAGLFSRAISLAGYQQALSIFAGIILLLFIGWNRLRQWFNKLESYPSNFASRITDKLKSLLNNSSHTSLFIIGVLNGFLPCGFVYMALGTAVTFGSVQSSSLFMSGFGLGTVPAMLSVSLAGGWISMAFRQKLQKLSPYFIALVGLILILRGLNLGIPFLSPNL